MEDRPGKIFVGGLDFDIDEAEFEKIFAKFGKITEVLLKREQQSGKSRGFGFITYENPSDADEAVKQLDKQDIKGKMVHVDHAVKPGGSSGGDRGGRGGFRGRGRGFGSFRDGGRGGSSFGSRGGGFRGRGTPRGDRGGRGGFGRGRGGDRPMRGSYGDDRRGPPPPRRSSLDRGYGDRRDEDRYGGMDRDRYVSSSMSDRRLRDSYPPSPPTRTIEREPVSSYRDYGMTSRDYSPPRERVSSRDYLSSRDVGVSRSSYDTGRDSYSTRDPYATTSARRDDYLAPRETRDDYLSPRDTRDYVATREAPRDYMQRETTRTISRDYERMPSRDTYDTYRERISTGASRGYMSGSPPPRSRSPLPPSRSTYSPPPRSAPVVRDIDRDRVRPSEYSVGTRRPATYDSREPPPVKRSRMDDLAPSRGLTSRDMTLSRGPPPRDGPPRGMSREGPRDTGRVPLRGPPRDGGRGGPASFRR